MTARKSVPMTRQMTSDVPMTQVRMTSDVPMTQVRMTGQGIPWILNLAVSEARAGPRQRIGFRRPKDSAEV